MHRETFIAKLSEIQENVDFLLAQLQASEHAGSRLTSTDRAGNTGQPCERAGKSGKQIERCLISTFQVAGSLGFKGDLRQWQRLLRLVIENCYFPDCGPSFCSLPGMSRPFRVAFMFAFKSGRDPVVARFTGNLHGGGSLYSIPFQSRTSRRRSDLGGTRFRHGLSFHVAFGLRSAWSSLAAHPTIGKEVRRATAAEGRFIKKSYDIHLAEPSKTEGAARA